MKYARVACLHGVNPCTRKSRRELARGQAGSRAGGARGPGPAGDVMGPRLPVSVAWTQLALKLRSAV